MDSTPNLTLPYIIAAQAQKHVTHNEAVRALDALVQMSVLDRDLTAPPPGPADGARYIVATGATGAWDGQAGKVAAWQDGGWVFYSPRAGWLAWVADESQLYVHNGSNWSVAGSGGGTNPTPLVGVNATADTTNRLSISSPSSLFNHEGTDHRLKISKSAAASTASAVFQDAFSGRAEIGLTGDDNLHFKVSADGSAWRDALIIDRTTAAVALPYTSLPAASPSLLINGDFQINQRAFAGGALALNAFGHDRWKASVSGTNYSVSGATVTLTSGTLAQVVETVAWGFDNLASTAVTVSVDTPSADLTANFGSASGTITSGSGRRNVTLTTAAGDTGNLTFKIAKASSGSVTFGRVKLETGTAVVTPWQPRHRAEELILAKRYYQRLGGAVFGDIQLRGYQLGGLYYQTTLLWPVELRATPTAAIAGTWGVQNCGQPQLSPATARTGRFQALVTATGDVYFYTIDATTYLELGSEL